MKKPPEKGQALILLVIAFVVLLGFAGLAIDGGMIYADRRHDQNGADSASLAGAGAAALSLQNSYVDYFNWTCDPNGEIQARTEIQEAQRAARDAAIYRARSNDFIIGADVDGDFNYEDNTVATRCGTYDNGGWVDKYIDITTTITSTTQTNFIHLLYNGPTRQRVRAVTRVRPRGPLGYGNAIVALNPAACLGQQNGAGFHGTADVYINGGGIWSNGCLRNNGTTTVHVDPGEINYVGEAVGNAGFIPAPQPAPYPIPESMFDITPPNCNDPRAIQINNARHLLNTASPLHGLYCISGDLRVNNNDSLIGNGVTFVMLNGSITINGGALVQLTAPVDPPNPAPAVPGLLIYLPPQNPPPQQSILLNGNSNSSFTGTILAPHADVTLLGTANNQEYHTQIIAWDVEAGGTDATNLFYQGGEQFAGPAYLDMYR